MSVIAKFYPKVDATKLSKCVRNVARLLETTENNVLDIIAEFNSCLLEELPIPQPKILYLSAKVNGELRFDIFDSEKTYAEFFEYESIEDVLKRFGFTTTEELFRHQIYNLNHFIKNLTRGPNTKKSDLRFIKINGERADISDFDLKITETRPTAKYRMLDRLTMMVLDFT
jgi:hypothetical protein